LKWPNLKVLVNPKQDFKKKTKILFCAFLLSTIEFKIRPLVTQNMIYCLKNPFRQKSKAGSL